MTKKKLDSRILSFLKSQNRSLFVVVGDKAQDACVTLHYLLNNTTTAENKNVIWCYKNELGFSTSKQKRMRSSKKPAQTDSPFELFVTCTDIRYCYYKETDSILGQTCQMLILQDFESITPNVLAKTIETVQAGGLVVLLLNTIKSLKQLYSLSMDVHARYRTEKHQDTVCRFNERFLLSLAACPQCLMMDDELNILPISAGKSCIQTVAVRDTTELEELVTSLQDTLPIGPLVGCCRTIDQAKAVLQFVDSIAEKTLRSTVTLTAARGRGKSAALGIAVASAVAYGYSNIFITSPTPENLKTLFQFILKGFDCLGYKEHLDYDVLQSTNPDFHKSIIRINVFKDHRQTIQWIQPGDYQVLAQAELLVIDEAAAIPLPLIKKLLGPYLVFMASTTNGYEGTGRSLSLKLYKQLRQESSTADKLGRSLREVSLEEPIRYLPNDEIEKWLNNLLCLDASVTNKAVGCPHPKECELYSVNRDTLFSFHPVSEQFLQMTMALYVAGHYKNSPNDLQLLSDAPAHQLFVLLPPTGGSRLPEPLVVVQVCLEGKIAQESVKAQMSRGVRANGDLIPWVVSQQFQDDQFAALSGARIVRVATHPNYMGMGYGSRAVELLTDYYAGKITNLSEEITEAKLERVTEDELMNASLQTEKIQVRDAKSLPPLLCKLSDRPAERIDWLGVSFGITKDLFKFWKKHEFVPFYLRQTCNDLTGEHTCIMIKDMQNGQWPGLFSADFKKRFMALLGYQFNSLSPILGLSVLESSAQVATGVMTTTADVHAVFSPYDLKRLSSYAHNLLDYHVILDLVPLVSKVVFNKSLGITVSALQAAILVSMGLQHATLETTAEKVGIAVSQILALFAKCIKKVSNCLNSIVNNSEASQIELEQMEKTGSKQANLKEIEEKFAPVEMTLEQDQAQDKDIKQVMKDTINSLPLETYAITSGFDDSIPVNLDKSAIIAVRNDDSTKKNKRKQGVADTLIGTRQSIVDPKGVLEKIKQKKRKLQVKKDKKQMNQKMA